MARKQIIKTEYSDPKKGKILGYHWTHGEPVEIIYDKDAVHQSLKDDLKRRTTKVKSHVS